MAFFLLTPVCSVHAQEEMKDTINKEIMPGMSKYDKVRQRYYSDWASLIPTQTIIQYAGNMGMLSIGAGWDYGKRKQWETNLLLGYLPKHDSKHAKITMTLKENFIPWKIDIGKNFVFEPLSTGLYVNTVFGREFWATQPDKYPEGYYKFATKIRLNVFVGQRITKCLDGENLLRTRGITLFYEVSSPDMYIFTKIKNSSLSVFDIISLSLGVKFQML